MGRKQIIAMPLHDFYSSTAWKKVRLEKIADCTTDAGILICSHCGKPILDTPEVHHIEHLTRDNFENPQIALNKDNLQVLHKACHNEIHNRYNGYAPKKVFVICGPYASGKLALACKLAHSNDLIISLDRIKDSISREPYADSKAITSMAFRIRSLLLDQIRTRSGTWQTAYIVEALPSTSKRKEYERLYGATLIELEASEEECIARAEAEERPHEYKQYIHNYFLQRT